MYIDIVVGIILVLGIAFGYKKGFFFEVLSFFILILNVVLAKEWSPKIYKYIIANGNTKINESILYFLIYLAVLVGLYIIASIILSILKKTMPKLFTGVIDSILGAILGGLKGLVLIFVLLLVFNLLATIVPALSNYSKDSKVNKFFLQNTSKLSGYYPDIITRKIDEVEFKKTIDKKIKEFMSK